jgi:hypothetical protein
MSASSKAAFARRYWDISTQAGTPHATTTFHTLFDKDDHWMFNSSGGATKKVQQYGARGMALGYLTKVRFAKFLQTREGEELTGVDCSRPGGGADREGRMRVISSQFFELLVQYSRTHPHVYGDYGNVARSRKLQEGAFCIFTGFSEALASNEFQALRAEWQTLMEPEPEPEPESESDPEPEPEPDEFDVKRVGGWSDETWVRFLQQAEEACVAQYLHALDVEAEEGARTVSGCQMYTGHSQFVVQCKRPVRASSERRPLTTIFFKGILKKQCKFAPLRMPTEGDLRGHFRWARMSGYPWIKFG